MVPKAGWVAVVVVCSACGENSLPKAIAEVIVRVDAASPTECPYGGSVVSSGLDTDGDAVLDDAEIVKRTVLCDPAPVESPPPIVIRLVAEPAGEHCLKGGTAVQSGPDRNANGQLDPDEVVHTDYVCGEALLTRFATEPAGQNCVAGGIVFFIGRDRDGDGELADSEIEHTELECGEVLSRDVDVKSAADVAALAKIRVIEGAMRVVDTGLDDVAFPLLTHVRSISIQRNRRLSHLSFPVLQTTQFFIELDDNSALATVELPMLWFMGGGLDVSGNPALQTLFEQGAPVIGGSLFVMDNRSLTSLSPGLAPAGSTIWIINNPLLAGELFIDSFVDGSEVEVINNGIDTLSVSTSSFFSSSLADVTVLNNSALKSLRVSGQQVGSLTAQGNASLSEVTLSADTVDRDVRVSHNDHVQRLGVDSFTFLSRPAKIKGSLFASEPLETFGAFAEIDHDCTLDGTHLSSLHGQISMLKRIGGTFTLSHNPLLREVLFIPVEGGVSLISNAMLGSVAIGEVFHSPTVYTESVVVVDNAELVNTQFLFLAQHIQGDLIIENNPKLLLNFVAGINTVEGRVRINGNPLLESVGLLSLSTLGGSLDVIGNASLPTVEIPALQHARGTIVVAENAAVQHLIMPALLSADMTVTNNPVLPACEVEALFARIGGSHDQSGNDETTSCVQ